MKKVMFTCALTCLIGTCANAGSVLERAKAWEQQSASNAASAWNTTSNTLSKVAKSAVTTAENTASSAWNAGHDAVDAVTDTPTFKSIKDRLKFFESSAPSELAKKEPAMTNELGQITRGCEIQIRADSYNTISQQCEAARDADAESGRSDQFSRFYATYQEAAPKLATLRDLGTYHPNPKLSKQEAMTSIDQVRSDGYDTLGTLSYDAPCEKFAEHMSIIHPANNGPFSMTMACIAEKRGVLDPDNSVQSDASDY